MCPSQPEHLRTPVRTLPRLWVLTHPGWSRRTGRIRGRTLGHQTPPGTSQVRRCKEQVQDGRLPPGSSRWDTGRGVRATEVLSQFLVGNPEFPRVQGSGPGSQGHPYLPRESMSAPPLHGGPETKGRAVPPNLNSLRSPQVEK